MSIWHLPYTPPVTSISAPAFINSWTVFTKPAATATVRTVLPYNIDIHFNFDIFSIFQNKYWIKQ